MQYKLSKDQWIEIGEAAGWLKSAAKKNPCWKTHKMIGTREVNGRPVPNCVPKKPKKKKS